MNLRIVETQLPLKHTTAAADGRRMLAQNVCGPLVPQQGRDGQVTWVRARACVQMMELVELTPLRHLLVGSPAETGLSVEQRKRLSIAVELISNPAIVLMDEPTSGIPDCGST